MKKTSEYYEFKFHKLHKSQRKCGSPPLLENYASPSDKALCLTATLECYIERNQSGDLLISFVKQFNAVTKSAVPSSKMGKTNADYDWYQY